MNLFGKRVLLLLASLQLLAPVPALAAASADQVLAAVNKYVSFSDTEMVFDMEVRNGDRVNKRYQMRVKTKDRERMRVEFEQPAREKGRSMLRVGDKMWMFLPDLGKAMVISSRQSFVGSAFSNGDLLRTDLVADYAPTLGSGDAANEPYRLELKARSASVTYDRIIMWVARDNFRPLRAEYFTRSGKRLRTLEYDRPATLNGVSLNQRMTIRSDLKRDEVTVLEVVSLVPARSFPDALFVKENLDRR